MGEMESGKPDARRAGDREWNEQDVMFRDRLRIVRGGGRRGKVEG
jgi:hypothetical protein